jgi:hypothetical protein
MTAGAVNVKKTTAKEDSKYVTVYRDRTCMVESCLIESTGGYTIEKGC